MPMPEGITPKIDETSKLLDEIKKLLVLKSRKKFLLFRKNSMISRNNSWLLSRIVIREPLQEKEVLWKSLMIAINIRGRTEGIGECHQRKGYVSLGGITDHY